MNKFLRLFYDNRIDSETRYGAIFGIVAIIAVVIEVVLSGFSLEGIVAGVKDGAGTLVALAVFWVAASTLIPKAQEKSFEDRMTAALEGWVSNNSNMIIRTPKMPKGHETDFGLSMKTDMNDFYNEVSTTTRAGWFVRIPAITEENYSREKIELSFHLNAETFFGRGHGKTDEELANEFDTLSKMFAQFINRKFSGFAAAAGKNDSIKVVINDPITTDDDIATLVDLINTAYTAYLVSSHIKVK